MECTTNKRHLKWKGNVFYMASHRESRDSSDGTDSEEEVPTGPGSFPQPYAFEQTSASVN